MALIAFGIPLFSKFMRKYVSLSSSFYVENFQNDLLNLCVSSYSNKIDLGQSSNRFLNAFHARQLSRAIGDVHDRNGLSRSMLQRQKTLKSPIISSSLITHVLPTQEFCDNVQNLCCRMHSNLLLFI